MADSAQAGEADPETPSWGSVRQAVMAATEVCAAAVVALAVRGPHAAHAMTLASQSVTALRDLSAQLRVLAFDDAVVETERARAAAEALAAAGIAVPPQAPCLHVVS